MYIPAKLDKINKIAKRKKKRKTKPGDIKEDDCLISKRRLDIEIMLKVCAFVIKSKIKKTSDKYLRHERSLRTTKLVNTRTTKK